MRTASNPLLPTSKSSGKTIPGIGITRLQLERNFELCDCLCQTSGAHIGISQIQMALHGVRLYRQGLLIFDHCLSHATALQKSGGEIKLGINISRLMGKSAPELLDRGRGIPLVSEEPGQGCHER